MHDKKRRIRRFSTHEEVLQQHVDTLGTELGPIYNALYNECALLHIKWQQYVELFGTKPERIDLLNEAASLFFKIIADTLWDDTLLHLTKLTDPPGSGKKKQRLTIQRLPRLIADDIFKVEVEQLIDAAVKATEFARDWRNRRIAHRNLALAIKQTPAGLTPASREKIKNALEAVTLCLQRVHEFYFNSKILFGVSPEPNGAVDLLYVINDGIEARRKRLQRLRDSRILPEDIEPPPSV